MTNKNLLFHQRQVERLWLAVRAKLSEGHALPENVLKGKPSADWLPELAADKDPSDETLNSLSNWLGYADLNEFSQQNNRQPSVVIPQKIRRNYIMGLVALGIITMASVAYSVYLKSGGDANPYSVSEGTVSEKDRLAIETLIKNATDKEFATYKTAPNPDTTGLSRYFVPDGKASKVIVANVLDASKCNWTLQNEGNASYFVLIETDVKNSDGETAEVITRENWYLEYFLPDSTSSVYTYNNLSTQYYQVKKSNGIWKVFLNAYPSTKKAS